MTDLKHTPLYEAHIESGAKIVDFSGWNLPIHYGSQIAEHEAVRQDAGMFDVSHMLVSDITGSDAKKWLRRLLANDVTKLTTVGKALYSPMLNENGGIIDDLIVYRLNEAEDFYRIVSNAATRDKDLTQFKKIALGLELTIQPRYDLAILAVQGPNAINKITLVKPDWSATIAALSPFQGQLVAKDGFIARTGYTGEEGLEIILPASEISTFFNQLKQIGVKPCGLGARDTLRLEAGMNLYGHDMDDTTSPLESGMAWTVSLTDDRDFIGKSALVALQQSGIRYQQVGLLLEKKGVLREGMKVIIDGKEAGIITSGTFSPSLKQSIAIARVPVTVNNQVQVAIRGVLTDVRVLKLPFVRHGKQQFA